MKKDDLGADKCKNKIHLKKKILGLFSRFSDLLVNQGLRFAIQIVLAKLLLLEDFGISGMLTVFYTVT